MLYRTILAVPALAVLALTDIGPAAACGPDTDCVLGERTYRIAVPPGDGPFGAILYMHGYQGTAAGVMESEAMRAMADGLGVALIAAKSASDGWLIRNAPRRNLTDDGIELSAIDAVLEDAERRFPIDGDRILAAGFSGGAMMTWTLACRRPDRFVGFVPVSGTFWAPLPTDCIKAPVNLMHVHGRSDTVVPISGRANGATHQGDVMEALAAAEQRGHIPALEPTSDGPEGLDCEEGTGPSGNEILFCLHDGGHMVDPAWIAWAWHRFAGE